MDPAPEDRNLEMRKKGNIKWRKLLFFRKLKEEGEEEELLASLFWGPWKHLA